MLRRDEPIDQEWVKQYVDALLNFAGKAGPGPMQSAALLRADHAMDLVKAWRERNEPR